MPVTDFDFLPGRWRVANRKLVDTLDPATPLATSGRSSRPPRRPAPSSAAEATSTTSTWRGRTTRGSRCASTTPGADLWRIWWSSTARPGWLDPPVEGRFDGEGRARFECDDVLDGVPIRMRFDWSEITDTSARWEQAFSFDGGDKWKTNWIMLLSREP
jgi:hypothetical protein